MEQEFEYGELVEVRDYNSDEWRERVYVGTFPHTKLQWCMPEYENKTTYNGRPVPWLHIRKIKPQDDLIEIEQPESIEQRLDKFEAILNRAIARINEQIESINNSLK